MIKAVIFDLDGTLCYTIDDLRTAMNEMLEKCNYPIRSKQQIVDAINCGPREFVRRSLPDDKKENEEEVSRCHAIYAECYQKHFMDSTHPYDGISELLTFLKGLNIKLAVLTNKSTKHAKPLIEKMFSCDVFDYIVGSSPDFPPKPDPAVAYDLIDKMGVSSKEVLYIGDSNVDMETANNSGFFAIGVTWGYRDINNLLSSGANAIVTHPKQIELYFNK